MLNQDGPLVSIRKYIYNVGVWASASSVMCTTGLKAHAYEKRNSSASDCQGKLSEADHQQQQGPVPRRYAVRV